MPWYLFVISFVSAFVIAYLAMPLVIGLAYRIGAVDRPDSRKVHSGSMPRMGGMAIFFAFMAVMLFMVLTGRITGAFVGIIYGSIIIFLVGLVDDIFQIRPRVKLLGQIAAAAVAIYFGVVVHFVTNPFDGWFTLGYFAIPVTLLWVVGITNAINLIDGLDGLAAGVSAIAAITMAIIAVIKGQPVVALATLVLVGAILGFLPYNFYPARTFMGDSGSNFLALKLRPLTSVAWQKSFTKTIQNLKPIIIIMEL